MPQQLLLDINLPDLATFNNYIVGPNSELVSFLKDDFMERSESFIYLWGSIGSGKTHLLQACCHEKIARNQTAFYLNLADFPQLSVNVLQGLEQYQLVCLDNIESICNNDAWQEALFYFFNMSRDCHRCLLIAADRPPMDLPMTLADLKSRLSWGLVLHSKNLNDDEKANVLKIHAKQKGFTLSQEVCQYILTHYTREPHQLMSILNKIDKESLLEKRKVTIPFLKTFLNS